MEILNYCLCGCGNLTKSKFIRGHNLRVNNPMKKIDVALKNSNTKIKYKGHVPYETRICLCGCGRNFKCKITSVRKYVISGHANKNRTYEQIYGNSALAKEHRDKRGKAIGKSLKGRSWEEKFGKEYTLLRKQSHGDRSRKRCLGKTYEELYGVIVANQIKQKISLNSGWRVYLKDKNLLSIRVSKILSKVCQRPNKFEYRCGEYLNKLFPDKFKYVGDGSVLINHKSPDFICEELSIIVLCNGIYWHLFRKGLKLEDKQIVELKESAPFIKAGYEVWFIWETYETEINKVTPKEINVIEKE